MIEIIALFALIMFAGYFAEQFFSRTNIPDIFLLLLLGLFLGPAGGTQFIPGLENVTPVTLVPLAALIAVLTLVVILFEAGTGMDIGELWKNSTFAFTGTVLNFIVTTGACFVSLVLMGWNSVHALLVALLLADTAEEVVYSLVAKLELKDWLRSLIIFEGAFTSTLIGIFTVLFISLISAGTTLSNMGNAFLGSISIAIVVGASVSYAWVHLLVDNTVKDHRYFLSLAMAMVLYATVEALSANGVIAVLVFGLMMGTAKERLEKTLFEFHKEVTFIVRSFFFVYLGYIVSFENVTPNLVATSLFAVAAMAAGRLAGMRYIIKAKSPTKAEIVLLIGALPCGLATAVFATVLQKYGINIPFLYEFIVLVIFESIIFSVACTYYYAVKQKEQAQPAQAKPKIVSQSSSKQGVR